MNTHHDKGGREWILTVIVEKIGGSHGKEVGHIFREREKRVILKVRHVKTGEEKGKVPNN